MGHALMENRNGLVVDTALTKATGTAEHEAAIAMVEGSPDGGRITLGTDKSYDTKDFVVKPSSAAEKPLNNSQINDFPHPVRGVDHAFSGSTQTRQRNRAGVIAASPGTGLQPCIPASRHRGERITLR